jgi:hypothetical protein
MTRALGDEDKEVALDHGQSCVRPPPPSREGTMGARDCLDAARGALPNPSQDFGGYALGNRLGHRGDDLTSCRLELAAVFEAVAGGRVAVAPFNI